MLRSRLPEATTVEFQARVPTRDVCAVSSLICKERRMKGGKGKESKGTRESKR